MDIKPANPAGTFQGGWTILSRWTRICRWVRVILAFTFLLGLLGMVSAASFYVGAKAERRMGVSEKLDRVFYQGMTAPRIVSNYFSSFGTDPERIVVDIKHKHFVKLANWRKQALERGQITSDLKQRVPGKIRFQDQELNVRLRLKGEWTDHLNTEKWSFRVSVKNGNLFGMRRFSLQHPKARHYIYEWLYLKALEREDIVSLRYKYVALTLNGKDLGIYAIEESPAKQLIEHCQRREGVVLRLNEDFNYKPFADHSGRPKGYALAGGLTNQNSSEVVGLNVGKLAENPELRKQFLIAHNLLTSFRVGKLSTSRVFNIEKLAMYFAVSELMGSVTTSTDWSDLNFLYDPVSSRLEPIGKEGVSCYMPLGRRTGGEAGFDYVMGAEFTNNREAGANNMHSLMFSDPEFFRVYVEALTKVSTKEYIDELLADLGPEMKEQSRILHREWPFWDFNRKRIDGNAKVIRAVLAPDKGIHAYLHEFQDGVLTLDIGTIQLMPVEILGVVSGNMRFDLDEPVALPGKARDDRPHYKQVAFQASANVSWSDEVRDQLQIHYRMLGTTRQRDAEVFPWKFIDDALLAEDLLRAEPNPESFDFLEVSQGEKVISVKPGKWQVAENMILPAGYRVLVGEGVQIDLVNSAKILSYSPISMTGTETKPVVIHSTDQTGQGMIVLHAKQKSLLEHAVFDRLSSPTQAGWSLTGAVTFYESPVEIRNCEFKNNSSEDSLNIIRSEFSVSETGFGGAPSDAVDIDFSSGRIVNCSFYDIKGDGVDFSGSTIELSDLFLNNVADKGISVGEATYLTGQNIEIANSRIGIAVKDLSEAKFSDVKVSDAEMGIAVFQKKVEYGPAKVDLERLTLERVARDYVVEYRSTLTVSGDIVPENQENASLLIYGAE